MSTLPKFIQLTASASGLFALDETGQVWKYHPENKSGISRYAFWGRLTAHRAGVPRHETAPPPPPASPSTSRQLDENPPHA